LIKKYIYQTFGFMIITFGIVGVIFSKLGAAPIDAFNYFLYRLTPLSLGTIAVITGLLISLFAYLIDRNKDMIISVIFLFIIGVFIDIWKYLYELLPNNILESYYFRVPLAIMSLFIISYGVAITITSGLPSSPFERLLLGIDKKIKNLKLSKILIEGSFFLLAIVFGLIAKELFEQVHLYTVVIVFSIGPLIEYFVKKINIRKELMK